MRLKLVLILFTCTVFHSLNAMPPAPGVIDQLRAENRLQDIVELHASARERGMNQPFDVNIQTLGRDGADEITINAVCILVDFADNQANENLYSADHFREMLFSVDEYRTGSLRDWFLENSYGELNITGEVAGWYEMPNDYEYYVNGRQGFGNYPRNARRLVEDALNAADDDINFREFDNNDNGVVEALFIVHAGEGAEATGSDDMIWSHAAGVANNIRFDNMRFGIYAMEPENGRIGVFGHELGHSAFGLPDLYDTNYESAGVGQWSMMSGGSWGGGGNTPVHFDAWCKFKLGIVAPFPVIQNIENIILEPIEIEADVLMVWREDVGNWGNEYFLIENRQTIGFDRSLPGSGILIWHIDEDMRNNRNPWYPGIGRNIHNIVALEQADGAYNLEHDQNSGDAGDPFPGTSWNEFFGENTSPDSRDYSGNSTGVNIHNIERADPTHYRFHITLDEAYEPDRLSLFLLTHIPEDHSYPHPDDRQGELMTTELELVSDLLSEIGVARFETGEELPANMNRYNMIIYLESWREEDGSSWSLSQEEQIRLRSFLSGGGKMVLIGPDIATNLQGDDNPLWESLLSEYMSEGLPREEGNFNLVQANVETRFAGQTFPYQIGETVDHYVDEVGPAEGAQVLFQDDGGLERGTVTIQEDGSRVILQPFLFGGLVDWGGSKARLVSLYVKHMQLSLAAPGEHEKSLPPAQFELLSAYPNPFNGSVNIRLIGGTKIHMIDIYDFNGRKVDMLRFNGRSTLISWKPENLPTGSYFIIPSGVQLAMPTMVTYLK